MNNRTGDFNRHVKYNIISYKNLRYNEVFFYFKKRFYLTFSQNTLDSISR